MFARVRIAILALVCLCTGAYFFSASQPNGSRVVFLAVGQGDATLFMSDNYVVLVDVAALTDGFDAGERLVAPELRKRGVRKIDCLIITHPDSDHIGGLSAITSRYRIGKIILNNAFRNDQAMLQALNDGGANPQQVQWIDGVWKAKLGEFDFTIAAPPLPFSKEPNEGSLFIRADDGEASLLITGDANVDTEARMSGVADWDVDILKAGHHGSKNSTSKEWLELTSPEIVIASCGRDNRYGHPAPAMIERVKDYGAEFLRTDRDGTIEYEVGPGGFVRVQNR